jgi:hypothetical protein
MIIQVSYKFASLPDSELDKFTGTVLLDMTGNPVFPTLPTDATLVMLGAARVDFSDKLNKAAGGGMQETEAKNLSRQELLKILRKIAGYVQITSNTREDVLSAGFDTRSTNNAREPLAQPTGVRLKNGTAGQLVARTANPVKNANLYEGRASVDGGAGWLPSVFTGDSRHIIFEGLTPGAVYTIQVRALGGLTGQSDWSDSVAHRSM